MASVNNIYNGLEIIKKYMKDPNDCCSMSAAHDQIWAGDEGCVYNVSVADEKLLDEYGWFMDGEFECWSHFT